MSAIIVSDEDENPPFDSTARADSTRDEQPEPQPVVETPPAPPPSVPDKFAGKTPEQLIAMYADLEKVTGRQGKELGELRSTHDQYIRTALEAAQGKPAQNNTETVDDTEFFINPRAAIEKAVENHPLIKEVKQKQAQSQQERAQQAFEAKHPDAAAIVEEAEFRAWVESVPARRERLLKANADYDFGTADEIFATYKEIKAARTSATPAAPPKQDNSAARAAALTAGKVPGGNASPTGAPTGKIFYRSDLARLRNTDPERYHEMSDEILLAYKEKRVK
jgi:hypothetical protein